MPVETTLHTVPIGGGEPIETLPAEIIKYGYRLNRPGPIEFRLSLDHELTRRANVGDETEAVVVRNGETVWQGPIWVADETDADDRVVKFEGLSLEMYLFGMLVTQTLAFNQVDQFDIARALVDHHQSKPGGDFGIDTAWDASTSGVLRDRTYPGFVLKNVGDAVTQLAEVGDGFDFHIEAGTRRLRLHYPKRGSRKTDLIWDERTIRSFGRRIDKSGQASQMWGVGAGEGEDQLRFSLTDSTALARYGLTMGTYSNLDVSEAATLENHVRRVLRQRRFPAESYFVTVGTSEPPIFSYQVGDEGQLRWPSPYDPVNRFVRLVGFDVVWKQGIEEADLFFQELSA